MTQPHAQPPRVALVHAVMVAMGPIERAFQRLWPQAQRANLLDDALSPDLERDGVITPAMTERICRLAEHGVREGAQGVLFTCSAFGPAVEVAASRLAVPVLKPNEPMFEAALDQGLRVGMVATFAASVASMEDEFRELAARRGVAATLETVCVPEALIAAKAGDVARHNRLVAEAAPRLAHCDTVMLAHFSTSTALDDVERVLGRAVLSAPEAAVAQLKRRLACSSISSTETP